MSEDENSLNNAPVGNRIALWKQVEKQHKDKQLINPFSEWEGASTRAKLRPDDPEYAQPVAGSMTAKRGQAAGQRISGEIQTLIDVIGRVGQLGGKDDPRPRVTFGRLFEVYVKISNKLVGILLRARKQGLVDFEGEMLWQGKDDHVVITLLASTEGKYSSS
ncbi:actin-binding Rho-activating protein-like [Acanthaster planci]|uniref:Actin-binding Rho-activating protein-like n=1 Tax=Acanthaster planci TaxID=133434 RepID=A0A8B7YD48_ACAPL|nr:actin-binding Rho-activating protein-like [Acanthaster planci]XP_022091178.1 actin-binding Rho-activating protein-like [Acanthaster planci]XP_022091179.1 actin-binding Rho-activating protein-like [Acanthaster planci]